MKERGAQKVGQIDGAVSEAFAGIPARELGRDERERGAKSALHCYGVRTPRRGRSFFARGGGGGGEREMAVEEETFTT